MPRHNGRCGRGGVGRLTDTGERTAGIRLAPDLSYAEGPGGERIVFTRSERRVLEALTQHRDRIVTREQLLDAIAGPGSDHRDRNIDFLINRLRRKLSDDARHPRFITTRYGEGYIWTGSAAGIDASQADAYLIVGPLRGIGNLADRGAAAERFASHLHAAFHAELPPEKPVVLAPDCPPPTAFPDAAPQLSVELTFFEENRATHCVATARQFRTRLVLAVRRVVLPGGEPTATIEATASLSRALLAEIWRALATKTEDGVPMPVLMQLASVHPAGPGHGSAGDGDRQLQQVVSRHERRIMAAWTENGTRLKGLIEARPDDPILKVMYATHIHSKYVQFGYTLFQNGIDDRAADEDEIERLVLEALPHIQSHPEYAIMSAKLLNFLQRGYFELARELSEQAYGASVAAAGSLAIIGQFRAFAGEMEAALRCLDQALNLFVPGSPEHFYTLTLKLQALHAAGDFERLQDAKRVLYRQSPALMLLYEPLFAHPERLSFRAKAVMLALTERKAVGFLRWQHYVSARLFRKPEHRTNASLTLLTLIVRRFGKAAVPDEIAATHPGLLDRLG